MTTLTREQVVAHSQEASMVFKRPPGLIADFTQAGPQYCAVGWIAHCVFPERGYIRWMDVIKAWDVLKLPVEELSEENNMAARNNRLPESERVAALEAFLVAHGHSMGS